MDYTFVIVGIVLAFVIILVLLTRHAGRPALRCTGRSARPAAAHRLRCIPLEPRDGALGFRDELPVARARARVGRRRRGGLRNDCAEPARRLLPAVAPRTHHGDFLLRDTGRFGARVRDRRPGRRALRLASRILRCRRPGIGPGGAVPVSARSAARRSRHGVHRGRFAGPLDAPAVHGGSVSAATLTTYRRLIRNTPLRLDGARICRLHVRDRRPCLVDVRFSSACAAFRAARRRSASARSSSSRGTPRSRFRDGARSAQGQRRWPVRRCGDAKISSIGLRPVRADIMWPTATAVGENTNKISGSPVRGDIGPTGRARESARALCRPSRGLT